MRYRSERLSHKVIYTLNNVQQLANRRCGRSGDGADAEFPNIVDSRSVLAIVDDDGIVITARNQSFSIRRVIQTVNTISIFSENLCN